MIRLLGDLFIGWIIFTPEGKKTANKIVNTVFNTAKNNIINSSLPIMDIISGINNDKNEQQNNGTKDR